MLADLTINGRARKVVMVANRNGFFYTLDRETGEFLVGQAVYRYAMGSRADEGRASRSS